MGINVQLRSEGGEIFEQVYDLDNALSLATQRELTETRLLKYLVPWGDSVFNQAQAVDLDRDVSELLQTRLDRDLKAVLQHARPLLERLGSDAHLYLWFVGD